MTDQDAQNQAKTSRSQPAPEPPAQNFPVVGLGASAGGLEALEQFFRHMPPDSGMAFVVVQHLDPRHKSVLTELIGSYTSMAIFQAEAGLRVAPNCVYVIPPNREMTIRQGVLDLTPIAAHSLRLPIDGFFRSLAEDQGEQAIGVILSGAGSDGTLGLKAIKEKGGLLMAQTPESARYDSMPYSAVNTGLVDYVLPPVDMPARLLAYLNLAPLAETDEPAPVQARGLDSLQKIFVILRAQTGHDFSLYKKNTVRRRLERRMAVRQIERVREYVDYLRQNPAEVRILFKELLIGVTSFFRDAEAFAALEQQVIPHLLKDRRSDQPLRVWTPGCATGEEAYCLAILLREQVDARQTSFKIQLFATDIDEQALEQARLGLYPLNIAKDVSTGRLQRFFSKIEDGYQVNEQLRKMIVFAGQSVIKDPPFSKLDLISCRNLLIYLEPELQKRVMSLFYYALKPGGFLFLGTSETPVDLTPYFTTINRKWKIFQRPVNGPDRRTTLEFPAPTWTTPDLHSLELDQPVDTRAVLERVLLEQHVSPCLVINDQSEILFIYGRVGKYLEPVAGEAGSWHLLRLVREGLRIPIATAVRQALARQQEAVYEDVRLEIEAAPHTLTVTVRPLLQPTTLQGLLIVIIEEQAAAIEDEVEEAQPKGPGQRDQYLADLERELQATKEYLQAAVEELESSNEEIKSTNEELQSANEELETSQEETQSINEELVTLNAELEKKVDELTWVNSDINNLLTSIDVGIIFLDRRLNIRRFNRAAVAVINLIETDPGRPIRDIASRLVQVDWVGEARAVFETLVPRELEVQTEAKRWYLMRLRPYRTVENAIEGVVITLTDITQQKEDRQAIQEARELAENIVDAVRQPLLVLATDLRVVSANRAFYHAFRLAPETTEGKFIYDLDDRQWDIPRLREALAATAANETAFEAFEVEYTFPEIGPGSLRLDVRPVKSAGEQAGLILLAIDGSESG